MKKQINKEMEKAHKELSMEIKRRKAVNNHLENMQRLSNEEDTDYSYLYFCWICNKKITFWDYTFKRFYHSFEGNCHKRCANAN